MGLLETAGQFTLYSNHFLQKPQPISRKLGLLFNQTVIIGVSKVHKHIQTLLCPAKLWFFPEFEKDDIVNCVPYMHRSIPAVPMPTTPPIPLQMGNREAFAQVVSSGGWAFAILSCAGGWALAYPRATPGHLTHVFSEDG